MHMFVMVGGIVTDYCRKAAHAILRGNLQCETYRDALTAMDPYKYPPSLTLSSSIFSAKLLPLSTLVRSVSLELQLLHSICEVALLIGRDGAHPFPHRGAQLLS